MIVLYILFALSVFCPFYTYVIYPMILKIIKGKQYKSENITPTVTVIVVGDNTENKIKETKHSNYSSVEVVAGNYEDASKSNGDIIVFTDTKTELDLNAIHNIVKPFFDERVGVVVGQQTNAKGNSAFWKYENLVKKLESKIGCVSGANNSLFAVRKTDLPVVPSKVINKPFYIVTKITELGKAVVFQDSAKAYEGDSEGANFEKHVKDAAGYWQALKLFPKMLLPRPGSFVYISHRVMKWFVWLNLVMMIVISGFLGLFGSVLMQVLFWLQIACYLILLAFGKRKISGAIGKLIGIGYYFMMLNVSFFIGMFKVNL